MELVPGLHWIEGQRSNIYIWEGNANPVLVDTGMPGDDQIILDTIRELGYRPADIKAIFITHADLDHAGSAAVIQKKTNATIYAGSQTAEYLQRGKSPKHMPWLLQFFLDRFSSYARVPAAAIQKLSDGDQVPDSGDWLTLSTPGHTLDHFAFCSTVHGILFAGDALNTRNDRLQGSPKRFTADQDAARQSANRLLRLTPAVIACGHGQPMLAHDAGALMTLFHELQRQTAG